MFKSSKESSRKKNSDKGTSWKKNSDKGTSWKKNSDKGTGWKKNSGKETNGTQKDIRKKVGMFTGATLLSANAVILSSRAYADVGYKKRDAMVDCVIKSAKNQTYEALTNSGIEEILRQNRQSMISQAEDLSISDIDGRIGQKTEEIELLKKRLAATEEERESFEKEPIKKQSKEIRKKQLEDLRNLLFLQIQNGAFCLNLLEKQKELQRNISRNLSKRKELIEEKRNLSFLHPKKKKGIENDIIECDSKVENNLREYKALEHNISENEKIEETLVGENKVTNKKPLKLLKFALTIVGICLVCGMITLIVILLLGGIMNYSPQL
ncbi:MAG: hypothetical protein NC517_01385 [Firmicutes bacterium]|nr:hypothetical protein [Bacillota bacterium]